MAPLGSSASAPDLRSGGFPKDRARLQNLLTKANDAKIPLRRVGGAPRSLPPARAASTGAVDRLDSLKSSGGRPAVPGMKAASSGSPRAGAGGVPPHAEKAGYYVRNLIGQHPSSNGPMDWRLVQELDAVDGLLQEDQARRQEIVQKHNLRDHLNKQRIDAQHRRYHSDDEQKQWGNKLQADADVFWQEQSEKREADRQVQARFNQEQARLLDATNRRRLAEKQRDIEIERQMTEMAAMARKIEVAKDEERKRRQKEEADKCQKLREQAAVARKEKQRQEAIRDIEVMQQQQEKLEKQERERTEKFQKFAAAQAAKMKHFEATTFNEAAEQAKKDQERLRIALEEKSRKENEEFQQKLDKAQKEKAAKGAAIRVQMEEHREKRAQQREEELNLAKQFKRDADAAIEEELGKEQRRREKAKEHANFLLSQMQERSTVNHGRFGPEQMSAAEKAMNKDRFERASNSESLQLLFRNKQLQYRLAEKKMGL